MTNSKKFKKSFFKQKVESLNALEIYFQTEQFKLHVEETALKLNLKKEIVEIVMKQYFTFTIKTAFTLKKLPKKIIFYSVGYLLVNFNKKNNT